jgi:hypothetical protein
MLDTVLSDLNFLHFCLFFETGSCYVSQADLELSQVLGFTGMPPLMPGLNIFKNFDLIYKNCTSITM